MKKNSMLSFLKEKSFLIVLTLTLVSAGTMAMLFTLGGNNPQPGSEIAQQEESVKVTPSDKKYESEEQPQGTESEKTQVSEIELLETQKQASINNEENAVAEAELEDQFLEAPQTEEASASDIVAEEFGTAGELSLCWPVQGEVLMEFSMDHSVYFQTLAQYQYNPAMIISAPQGTEVLCAAPGTVIEVGTVNEYGSFVTMDLGDGYELTYGQLGDVTLEEGETVAAGETIGVIAAPSRNYVQEGDNLYLKLTKDGAPVDPGAYLAAE